MRPLAKFASNAEYEEAIINNKIGYPHVVLIDSEIRYVKSYQGLPDSDNPLYIEALEDLTVSFSRNAIQYSLDKATWVDLPVDTSTPVVSAGSKIYFRATNISSTQAYGIGTFTISGACNVGGNALALRYGADYNNGQELYMIIDNFAKLFYNASTIRDASRLSIPSAAIAGRGCQYMFAGCTNLVNAPALPKTLGYTSSSTGYSHCSYMYQGCTSLINVPALDAETIYNNSYMYMFDGCSSLVNAPAIAAKTLAESSCEYMFQGCTSLVNAPALPAEKLTNKCYSNMFKDCISLVNAPKMAPISTNSYSCQYMFYGCTSLVNAPASLPRPYSYTYYGMFYGCTSLVNAPALPSMDLYSHCYESMFSGCTSLVNAPALPATTLKNYCYRYMFKDCTSLVNAPVLPAEELVSNCYHQMFYGCTKLAYIKAMFTTSPASSYLNQWVYKVPKGGTFVKNAAATWTDTFGTSAIPTGWTVETAEAW